MRSNRRDCASVGTNPVWDRDADPGPVGLNENPEKDGMFDYSIEKPGEILLEANVEYRSKLIGFVDWAPVPQDKNMGIWREVRLKRTHNVSMNNTFVHSDLNVETLDEASLTISTELTNHTKKEVKGVLNGKIEQISF